MKIYKFSNVLSLPFALVFLFFISYLFKDTHDMRAAIATIPLVILVLIYLFQPQIDYWWLGKYPIDIDEKLLRMISNVNPFYRSLDDDSKKEFNKRMVLYTNGISFTAKGMEKDNDLPYDIKYMISQIPISLTFYNDGFLLKPYDHIVIYKHAFPSPNHPYLHTAETHKEDGVILFSLEHTEAAFFNSEMFFNVAWYAFAEAKLSISPINDLGIDENSAWSSIEKISGLEKDRIVKTLGFENPNMNAVWLTSFFLNKEKLQAIEPNIFNQLNKYLSTSSI